MKKYALLFLLFFPLALIAQEYTVKTVPNPKKADVNNYVSNPDHIISDSEVSELNSILVPLEADVHAEVAVVVLNSIGNGSIEDFAVRLFKEWGIGKSDLDNGLLMLFVLDERAITFEVGYGLEGVITDALSKRIQMQTMLPYFKEGEYGEGLIEGVKRVDSLIREEPVPEYQDKKKSTNKTDWLILLGLFVSWGLLSILLELIAAAYIKRNPKYTNNHDRNSAMKMYSMGIVLLMFLIPFFAMFIVLFQFEWVYGFLFFLFPIAVFPSQKVGKKMEKRLRTQPIPCDNGDGMMLLVPEDEDNKYLNPSQNFEEKIGSVDYDVFICDHCHEKKIFPYNEAHSLYQRCPQCGTRAFKQGKSKTLKAATYSRTGIKEVNYRCLFCGHEEVRNVTIPIKQRSSGGGGGGSFGGGSSSSGGSFGGGSSGGGGATSRW